MDNDTNNNGQIKYSIDFGNQQGYFAMNESTGDITLVKLVPLEAHQTEEFILVITATDGRSLQSPAANKYINLTLCWVSKKGISYFIFRRCYATFLFSSSSDQCCRRYKATVHSGHLPRNHRRGKRSGNSHCEGEMCINLMEDGGPVTMQNLLQISVKFCLTEYFFI